MKTFKIAIEVRINDDGTAQPAISSECPPGGLAPSQHGVCLGVAMALVIAAAGEMSQLVGGHSGQKGVDAFRKGFEHGSAYDAGDGIQSRSHVVPGLPGPVQ